MLEVDRSDWNHGAEGLLIVCLWICPRIVALELKGTWHGARACPFSVPNASNPNNDNEVDRSRKRRRGARGGVVGICVSASSTMPT